MRCLFVFDSAELFFPPWPRSSQVRERGVNSLKTVDFHDTVPLKLDVSVTKQVVNLNGS